MTQRFGKDRPRVFVSVGTPATKEQSDFVESLRLILKTAGVEPVTLGQTDWSHEQPLLAVRKRMNQCRGAVLVGLPRYSAQKLIVKPGSPKAREVIDAKLPTPWNQIEGTMAYALGLPLLVFVDDSLMADGLFERGFDWAVIPIDLTKPDFGSAQLSGQVNSWLDAVEDYRASGINPTKIQDLTVPDLLRRMPIPQLWALVGALAALCSLAFAVGRLW